MDDFSRQEKLADQYLEQNNKKAAVHLLFNLISEYAKVKNFSAAEKLRDKLSEADPCALFEIIKSDEIIEKEKTGHLYQAHLEIWSELYNEMTTDEACALYSGLEKEKYDTNDTIFEQGKFNAKLYFIDQGYLKKICHQDRNEILLETLGPGDVAGVKTFFAITVCTTSLITLSQVKLSFLNKDILVRWQDEFPSLVSKLNEFCFKPDDVGKKGINRRVHKRIKLTGKAELHILNTFGNPIGKFFPGNLSDISMGGLSFIVKMSDKKNPPLLLGRKLGVRFTLPGDRYQIEISQKGTIIGVTDRLSNHYSVHMKFDRMLDESISRMIERMVSSEPIVTRQKSDSPLFIQKIKKMLIR
ncbi:cyclic nucleotide-binding domain-containing protein [Desulfonema magnum]|uniref:Cyclic nucleotide-binding and PilZ domains-containing protein n=1 Tax=Desulfonema magnum TaxID=45655 RepID=A0A975GPL9_9BACT|nr:cyclic nucleotide-binding domain-containing protein [Desulfonema magnum]QTA88992.1 Cyclic nucleotide-binding and PilZ domains-containing protein [Desulfonema magnum]